MTNTATFDYKDLQSILGSAAADVSRDIQVVGVSTDTRTLQPGNVFIALRGENFDGHDYVAEASKKGAALILVEQAPGTQHLAPGTCTVPNTLLALGSFAWYHRRRFDLPVIAIGGASGKTSTKDLIAHVLSQGKTVLKTEANNNNQIGTPHTLLQLTREHDVAVIEIGTNEPGEIELLSAMVQPTHGLITTIGPEHLEKLIDLDGVEREETALFDYLRDHNGICFVNMDDERLRKYGQPTTYPLLTTRAITFGLDHPADILPSVAFDEGLHPIMHMVKDSFTFRAEMQTVGFASALNAAAAIAVAWTLGLGSELVKQGLTTYNPPSTSNYARMRIQHIGPLTVLNDSYNANPQSMELSLRTLAHYPGRRHIAVLGDMRELGQGAREEHTRILSLALSIADVVMLYGPEFEALVGEDGLTFNSHEEIAARLKEIGQEGDIVLVKGSRGLEMERAIDSLLQS